MPEEINLNNIHSEEVQDLIGRAPSWVILRGTIVVASILLLLLIGAWFIRYPDIVSAPVVLSASVPPVKIIAQESGRIAEFLAKDRAHVTTGEIIAIIDNSANTKDMLYLKSIVELLDTSLNIQKAIQQIALPRNIQVGEVQSDYAVLFQSIVNYNFFVHNDYYAKKSKDIGVQKIGNDKIKKGINEKSIILNDQLKLDIWKDSVNQILVKQKIIAPSEYNTVRKSYLTQRMTSADNKTALLQNEQQQREYQKDISDLQQQYKTGEKDVLLGVRDAAKKIKGIIADWERRYVLRSPLDGKVTFFKIWKSNQYVKNGDAVFIVIPSAQQYEVRAQLPVYKAGKIKRGQRVLIKLQEYPYAEFGMLKAEVGSITNVAMDSAYTVQLKLKNGFRTTRNVTISTRPEIVGIADIVTNDKNILQRIFEGMYGKIYER